MTEWLSPDEQRLWRAWIALSIMLPETLSRDLQTSHDLTGTDYMVLVVLSEAPQRRIRMSALAEETRLSRSRLSHQIDRMAAAGLVRRLICTEDGRGKYAELTALGWERLVAAAPDHVQSVRKHVLDQLSPTEFQAWGEACAKIVAGLGETHAPQQATGRSTSG